MKRIVLISILFLNIVGISYSQTTDIDSTHSYCVLLFNGKTSKVKSIYKRYSNQLNNSDQAGMVTGNGTGYIYGGSTICGKKESKEKVLERMIKDFPDAKLILCSELPVYGKEKKIRPSD